MDTLKVFGKNPRPFDNKKNLTENNMKGLTSKLKKAIYGKPTANIILSEEK